MKLKVCVVKDQNSLTKGFERYQNQSTNDGLTNGMIGVSAATLFVTGTLGLIPIAGPAIAGGALVLNQAKRLLNKNFDFAVIDPNKIQHYVEPFNKKFIISKGKTLHFYIRHPRDPIVLIEPSKFEDYIIGEQIDQLAHYIIKNTKIKFLELEYIQTTNRKESFNLFKVNADYDKEKNTKHYVVYESEQYLGNKNSELENYWLGEYTEVKNFVSSYTEGRAERTIEISNSLGFEIDLKAAKQIGFNMESFKNINLKIKLKSY